MRAIFMEYESNLKPIRREDMKELTQALTTSGVEGLVGIRSAGPKGLQRQHLALNAPAQ